MYNLLLQDKSGENLRVSSNFKENFLTTYCLQKWDDVKVMGYMKSSVAEYIETLMPFMELHASYIYNFAINGTCSFYEFNKCKILIEIFHDENGYDYINFYADPTSREHFGLMEPILRKFKELHSAVRKVPKINLVRELSGGFSLITFDLANTFPINPNLYDEEFEQFHNNLMNNLDEKGLTLIHGKPGTGKTNYIKNLTLLKEKKKFIFIPTHLSYKLGDPSFLSFLSSYPNSVLVIEDAENCLIDESSTRSAGVSTLLNITDGILADMLNIHVIATFNCSINHVDEALKRPGRLKGLYEFKEIPKEKIRELSNNEFQESMTVAEFYNKKLTVKKQTVGFKQNSTSTNELDGVLDNIIKSSGRQGEEAEALKQWLYKKHQNITPNISLDNLEGGDYLGSFIPLKTISI